MQIGFVSCGEQEVVALGERKIALVVQPGMLLYYVTYLVMGCIGSKTLEQSPGYEDPVVLAAETNCEYIPICSCLMSIFV